jgi:predicted TIM-barrel fold metal-dependent hydrolase
MTHVEIPLIDMHTHIGHLPGVVGDVYHAEDLMYVVEHEGIRFALASSASATTISREVAMREALDMTRRYGQRLGGILWINPHDPGWRDDVPAAVEAGFYGIKIHPTFDHYAVDRHALDEVFDCAREHKWPILTHADADGTPMSADKYAPLVEAYPDVVLILAHLRLEAIPLAKRHEQVFVDTAYVDPVRVELAVDALGPTKILFGSDACEGFDVGREPGRKRPPRSYTSLLAGLRARGIGDAALERICYANASELFRLS